MLNFVQGMNEIIGPLYYCFATDPHKEWSSKYKVVILFKICNKYEDTINNLKFYSGNIGKNEN